MHGAFEELPSPTMQAKPLRCHPGEHDYERVPEQVVFFGMGTTLTLFCRRCGDVITHPLKDTDDDS
jgi:hypothetical protein